MYIKHPLTKHGRPRQHGVVTKKLSPRSYIMTTTCNARRNRKHFVLAKFQSLRTTIQRINRLFFPFRYRYQHS
ncbi:hypothetical protein LSH36_1517g00008 [Paralvinella palmiformis]|uniref:Uncharacterized protein n=1 Tax=Paralvinella palmiformis TaxID=53620 RepID=A0AAD9ITI8_9ANNE|nr:hypothetical protein LSH36_1517g00008 [Paralvinella palmiformis]